MRYPVPVIIILLLNLVVFVAWHVYDMSFMGENFLVSYNALTEGRFWVLVTSVFSHIEFFHLFLNMIAFISFGGVMVQVLGPGVFTLFYLLAGMSGSLIHALLSVTIMSDPSQSALGASGAICGLILLFSLYFPQEKLLIMGLIPIRAIWGAFLLMALDVWGLIAQSHGGGFSIGHGAHLGGAMVGIIFYLTHRKKLSREDF